jgi:hypothetical protein
LDLSAERIAALADGTARRFSDWPNIEVPRFGAGVYTIWHKDGRFIYVGMSGRGITRAAKPRNSPLGLYTRLHNHWGGRRSGDQFCVYIADRFVLPTLNRDDVAAIAPGRHEMDAFVRRYIHDELLYRYIIVENGREALAIETAIKSGGLGSRTPFPKSWEKYGRDCSLATRKRRGPSSGGTSDRRLQISAWQSNRKLLTAGLRKAGLPE